MLKVKRSGPLHEIWGRLADFLVALNIIHRQFECFPKWITWFHQATWIVYLSEMVYFCSWLIKFSAGAPEGIFRQFCLFIQVVWVIFTGNSNGLSRRSNCFFPVVLLVLPGEFICSIRHTKCNFNVVREVCSGILKKLHRRFGWLYEALSSLRESTGKQLLFPTGVSQSNSGSKWSQLDRVSQSNEK